MARRSLKAVLVAMVVAMMVGLRDATGIGPPPPILSTERVEWLSPEPESDSPYVLVDDANTDEMLFERVAGPPQRGGGLVSRVMASLQAWMRR